jgi:hypothetical protein
MPARISPDRHIAGGELRRKVRRITTGCVALAAIASAALTANFAWAANDDQDSADSATAGVSATTSTPTGTATAAAPTTAARAAPQATAAAPAPAPRTTLAAPPQTPAAGKGRSHTQSGGS